jgi:hypothetical protein
VRLVGTAPVTTISAETTTPMRSPRWGHVTLLHLEMTGMFSTFTGAS